jgi:hypothetical protein
MNHKPKGKKIKEMKKIKKRDAKQSDVVAIYQSIKQNLIVSLAILCAFYAFTQCKYNKSNLLLCILSIMIITYWGYYIHAFSHSMKFKLSKRYKKCDNAFTRNPFCDWLMRRLIALLEFHHRTHHDSDINKSLKNIVYEFLNNLIMQGGVIILLKYLLNLMDNRVILLWALLYASVHNINYNLMPSLTHQQHHLDDHTNYGVDIWDILMGTKYDPNEIETYNHATMNAGVIAVGIVYLSNRYNV